MAITQEQLELAKATIQQMERSLQVMKSSVSIAFRGKLANLDLTADQIQELKDRYAEQKIILQTLFSELP